MWNLYPNSGISVESENEWAGRRDQKRKGESKAKGHFQSVPQSSLGFPVAGGCPAGRVGAVPRSVPGRGGTAALPPCPRAAGAKPRGGALSPAAAATMEGGAPPAASANGNAGAGGGGRGEGCEWPARRSGANFEGDIKGLRGIVRFLPLVPPPPPQLLLLLLLPPPQFQPCCPPAPRSPPATTSPGCRPGRASLL